MGKLLLPGVSETPTHQKIKDEDEEKRGFRLESGDKRGKSYDICLYVGIYKGHAFALTVGANCVLSFHSVCH